MGEEVRIWIWIGEAVRIGSARVKGRVRVRWTTLTHLSLVVLHHPLCQLGLLNGPHLCLSISTPSDENPSALNLVLSFRLVRLIAISTFSIRSLHPRGFFLIFFFEVAAHDFPSAYHYGLDAMLRGKIPHLRISVLRCGHEVPRMLSGRHRRMWDPLDAGHGTSMSLESEQTDLCDPVPDDYFALSSPARETGAGGVP